MKTLELTGAALNWAVAKCENGDWTDEDCLVNVTTFSDHDGTICNYSTDWAQGGPIIERERIETRYDRMGRFSEPWIAATLERMIIGPTPLIAAMRCYVTSKLGDEVDIPGELTD